MPQEVQLVINRSGICNNYIHGQGIIIEDSGLNYSSCCYVKRVIFKIHGKNKDVVCVLRKYPGNKDLLFLILMCHKLS